MNILIVEDSESTRYRLVALLSGESNEKVIAAVESAEEALAYMEQHCVDLVILDLCLPGLSYDSAVTAIKNASPGVEILVFTGSEEDEKVFSALKAGASGYILKSARPSLIISAIEEIISGGSPMSPSIARKVLQEFRRPLAHEDLKEVISPLSDREIEILNLLYRGLSFMEIAEKLHISYHTVNAHLKKIYTKLHVNSRSQAIYEALQKKLIDE